MDKKIILRILTPSKTKFRGEISYLEIPSISGIFGIMPGHIPIIAGIKSGTIKAKDTSGNIHTFNISSIEKSTNGERASGVLRFHNNHAVILIENETAIKSTEASTPRKTVKTKRAA